MAIPDMKWVIEDTRNKYPRAWDHCHHEGDPEAWDFIILAAREMSVHDNNSNVWGMNAKRGNMGDPSMDVIYAIDHNGTDGVFDVIGGAGGSNPQPSWNYLGPGENSTSGYIDPWTQNTHYDYSSGGTGGAPVEPPKPVYPTYEQLGGDEAGKKVSRAMDADYREAGRPGLDADCGAWMQRTVYDYCVGICATPEESVNKHRPEWRKELGLPPL